MGDKDENTVSIRVDMTNQGYDLPDWDEKTSYWCNYTPDRDSYLPYRGCYIDSHTKFCKSQVLMLICPISLLLVLNSTIT